VLPVVWQLTRNGDNIRHPSSSERPVIHDLTIYGQVRSSESRKYDTLSPIIRRSTATAAIAYQYRHDGAEMLPARKISVVRCHSLAKKRPRSGVGRGSGLGEAEMLSEIWFSRSALLCARFHHRARS
jgi:hypothetical protein